MKREIGTAGARQTAAEGWLAIMMKPRHLRKPAASMNSKFASICLARFALSGGGACNRTSSWLVAAPPRGVGCQPKSRRQAYRNLFT